MLPKAHCMTGLIIIYLLSHGLMQLFLFHCETHWCFADL
jgi:hypothetical protein